MPCQSDLIYYIKQHLVQSFGLRLYEFSICNQISRVSNNRVVTLYHQPSYSIPPILVDPSFTLIPSILQNPPDPLGLPIPTDPLILPTNPPIIHMPSIPPNQSILPTVPSPLKGAPYIQKLFFGASDYQKKSHKNCRLA